MKRSITDNRAIRRTLAAILWLALWQLAAMSVGQPILLASPASVLARFIQLILTADFWKSALESAGHILLGFALGASAGILLAVLARRSAVVEDLFAPLMSAMRSVPVASFVIVALIWLRARQLSVLIAFLIVLPVVYAGALAGLHEIDPKLLEMARVFRMPWHRRLCAIDLPASLPALASALGVAVGLAWKSGVAAEVIGIPAGTIGERLYKAKVYLATPDLFAWTLGIVLMNACCAFLLKKGLSALAAGLEKL